MDKFLCLLVDMQSGEVDLKHPTEIYATDKNQARTFLLENVPEQYIHSIFTVAQFNKKFNTNIQEPAKKENVQISSYTLNNEITTTEFSDTNKQNTIVTQNKQVASPVTTTFFNDDGIQFKLENNILYKKTWETIVFDNVQYRCINSKTKKQLKLPEKYQIQRFCWKQIKNS